MVSPESAAAGSLHSMKAVLQALKERDINVVKSSLWRWRTALPPRFRPPIQTTLTKTGRLMTTASRRQLIEWVELMEPRGLFVRSRQHRQAQKERLERLLKTKSRRLA